MRKFIAFMAVILCISNPCLSQTPPVTNPNINQVRNANLINEYARAMSNPTLVASYKWWKYINPNNHPYTPNKDTGIVNYSKRTSLSLVGWISPVNIGNATYNDSLIHLKPLTSLQTLELGGYWTGDTGLDHIRVLRSLKSLTLSNTGMKNHRITNAGMSSIAQLSNLEVLGFPLCTNVGDPGLNALSPLVKLREIHLSEWAITNAGLATLAGMRNLRTVNLDHTAITDAGLAHLVNLPFLESLNLEFDSVTNNSITYLSQMPALKTLVLGHTRLNIDEGYEAFKNMILAKPSLKSISLFGVTMSANTLARLRTACPGVAFHSN